MNKIIVVLFLLTVSQVSAQESEVFWKTKFYTLDSFQVSMNSFKGKPLVLILINSSNPDMKLLSFMDSIYRVSADKFGMIGILTHKKENSLSRNNLLSLFRSNKGISFPIASISSAKNEHSKDERNFIFEWLSENLINKHFKLDFNESSVLILNNRSALYAVLSADALPTAAHLDIIIDNGVEN
ncbi:MAG TPA: hypothetical protein VGN63_18940 [Flavisolibacter sp.]|jgi:hypothetical protein|nr:hypothetical protein [Flavisolibacter sp.]